MVPNRYFTHDFSIEHCICGEQEQTHEAGKVADRDIFHQQHF